MLVNDAEDADDEIEPQGVDMPVKHLVIEVEVEVEVIVTEVEVLVANEYLSLDTQARLDITLPEELNTYVTDTVYIALLLMEL